MNTVRNGLSFRRGLLLLPAALWLHCATVRASAADAADAEDVAAPPATQPDAPASPAAPADSIDPALRALVAKLGDDDPHVREDATRKLTERGKTALPALREAVGGDDPEARIRAQSLIRHIEGHVPPPGPNPKAGSRTQSVRTSIIRGVKTVDVNDNGQQIHITAQPDGAIEMTVTGIEDGKEATETYKARDAGELKRENPEAFALYDRWAGEGGAQVFQGGFPGPVPGGPNFPLLPPNGLPPEIPPEQRERILEQLRRAEAIHQRMREEAEQRVHDRLRGLSPDEPQKQPQQQPQQREQEKAEK